MHRRLVWLHLDLALQILMLKEMCCFRSVRYVTYDTNEFHIFIHTIDSQVNLYDLHDTGCIHTHAINLNTVQTTMQLQLRLFSLGLIQPVQETHVLTEICSKSACLNDLSHL